MSGWGGARPGAGRKPKGLDANRDEGQELPAENSKEMDMTDEQKPNVLWYLRYRVIVRARLDEKSVGVNENLLEAPDEPTATEVGKAFCHAYGHTFIGVRRAVVADPSILPRWYEDKKQLEEEARREAERERARAMLRQGPRGHAEAM